MRNQSILRQFAGRSAEDIRDELKNLLWFVRLIALGDYVLLHDKATDEVVIGQVISNVEHNITLLGPKFAYIRRVKWLKKIARDQFTEEAQADLYSILPLEDLRTHRYEIHRRATDEEENINIEREMFPPYEDIGTLKALVREWAWETEDFFQAIQDIRRGGRRD